MVGEVNVGISSPYLKGGLDSTGEVDVLSKRSFEAVVYSLGRSVMQVVK